MNETRKIREKIGKFDSGQSEISLNAAQLESLLAALKHAEEKSAVLSAIVESTDDAILSKSLGGIITSWNSSAERIFGYTSSEMIGNSIFKIIPAHLYEEEPNIIEQIKQGIRVDHFETQRLHKSGKTIDVALTISPIYNESHDIFGISTIARDLTLQRIAEVDAKRLLSIIETSDDAIISKDLNSIITSWNDSAMRIFGYSASEMIGESILKIIPPDRHEEEPRILAQLRQGIRVDHFETQRMRKDGSLIHVSLTISPIKDKNGVVIGLSKIARDITDQKMMESKKNEFISFVSHELKTPLTSLKSYIQIARSKLSNADFLAMALAKAEVQTIKMERMIGDFLHISKADEGLMKLTLATFNLNTLLEECLNDAQILSQNHELSFIQSADIVVLADSEKIAIVVTNLINNAIKYSPNGGKVQLLTEIINDKVRISVSDQGIGIPEHLQANLFQKFNRMDRSDTKNISGFGIGLYLSSTILTLHQSKLQAESKIGEGSTFYFDLPITH